MFRFEPKTNEVLSQGKACLVSNCLEVLQKPTIEQMHNRGMVVDGRLAYTDSAYWVNSAFIQIMMKLREDPRYCTVETSMYTDIMTCLGMAKEKEHVMKLLASSGNEFKKKICREMAPVELHVLAMPESKFYHFGTMPEYLEAFLKDDQLRKEMKFGASGQDNSSSVIMSSNITSDFKVPSGCVIEYSKILSKEATLGEGLILSCCTIPVDYKGSVPGRCLYQTVPIRQKDALSFVTIVFGTGDNLKKTGESLSDISWCGYSLESQVESTLVKDDLVERNKTMCLWNAKLFEAKVSEWESLQSAMDAAAGKARLGKSGIRYSMAELVKCFDQDAMEKIREQASM